VDSRSRFERVKHCLTGHMISWGRRCGFAYGEFFALPGPIGAADLESLISGAKATRLSNRAPTGYNHSAKMNGKGALSQ
jgi:hypothetical protein